MTKAQSAFCRELSIQDQLVQTRLFIEDYTEKLVDMQNGDDKVKVIERLCRLKTYYSFLLASYADSKSPST